LLENNQCNSHEHWKNKVRNKLDRTFEKHI
jgi:hypothetical protein